jgi:hypothetical protein
MLVRGESGLQRRTSAPDLSLVRALIRVLNSADRAVAVVRKRNSQATESSICLAFSGLRSGGEAALFAFGVAVNVANRLIHPARGA